MERSFGFFYPPPLGMGVIKFYPCSNMDNSYTYTCLFHSKSSIRPYITRLDCIQEQKIFNSRAFS
jgi:hypothetical protein